MLTRGGGGGALYCISRHVHTAISLFIIGPITMEVTTWLCLLYYFDDTTRKENVYLFIG